MAQEGTTIRDLLILGCGVHNLEMAEIVDRLNDRAPTWNLLGYVSPDGSGAGEVRNGYPVVGGPDAIGKYENACLVPGYGWPRSVPIPSERLISLVDPSTFVSRTARIGAGCVIYPNGFVGINAVLGETVFCLSGCVINHDCTIQDRVTLASGVLLAGSVTVEPDCYLGQGSTIRQQLRVGHGSLIGMGAVVVRDVAPGSVIVGNPGRFLRHNSGR